MPEKWDRRAERLRAWRKKVDRGRCRGGEERAGGEIVSEDGAF